MDHKLAEKLQLADKYMLHEMSDGERAQFEEHLFDCPDCSSQIRQIFTAVENLKEVLREQQNASVRVAAPASSAGWRDWLRLPSLVPSFVALALVGITVTQYVHSGAGVQALVLPPSVVLAPVDRGGGGTIPVDRKSPLFLLSFNVDRPRPEAYTCDFETAAGVKVLSLKPPPQSTASFNLPVLLPVESFPVGHYRMVLRPASEPGSISTYPFAIEDSK